MTKLSLEPYKGTRDFYPEDEFIQSYIFGVWKKVVESFGYVEYDASILEETELYKAKSGEEIVTEQTYTFTDRGGRNVTIRPEMTPTVARMVAAKRKELLFPLRWYSIPNLFRYERPQRGRLREHWQLNVDMFGIDSLLADVEIINIADRIMKKFGAKTDDFQIRVNNRKLLNHLLREHLKLNNEQMYKASKLIDRMPKISEQEFMAQAKQAVGEKAEELAKLLARRTLKDLDSDMGHGDGAQELAQLLTALDKRGIANVIYDPTLVRGFDYYTGTVFEIYDNSKDNPRALFGGGRYDDLVAIFGVDKVSGVGFGMGDVTIRDFLEVHKLLPEYKSPIDVYIAHMEERHLEAAEKLADELRSQGLNVAVDITDKKISNQVKTADRQKASFLIVVGDEEVQKSEYKLKNMVSGEEKVVSVPDIRSIIKAR